LKSAFYKVLDLKSSITSRTLSQVFFTCGDLSVPWNMRWRAFSMRELFSINNIKGGENSVACRGMVFQLAFVVATGYNRGYAKTRGFIPGYSCFTLSGYGFRAVAFEVYPLLSFLCLKGYQGVDSDKGHCISKKPRNKVKLKVVFIKALLCVEN